MPPSNSRVSRESTSFEGIFEGVGVEYFEAALGAQREAALVLVESDVEDVLRLLFHFSYKLIT